MEPTAPNTTNTTPQAVPNTYVDPGYTPTKGSFLSQNTFKIAVAVLGVLILGEIIWAGYTLLHPNQSPSGNSAPTLVSKTTPSPTPAKASLVLSGPETATVGATLKVSIDLSSSEATDGVDAVLKYDPLVFQALSVDPGAIYPEYPIKTIDAANGKITLSAVTSPDAPGFKGDGLYGSITLKTLKAGPAVISIDYVAGSTTDSNILGNVSAKDILTSVKDLNVNVK